MGWEEHYKRRLVTAEEAVNVVNSGDVVFFSMSPQPGPLIYALAARREELQAVRVHCDAPVYDPGWLQPGWQDSFFIVVEQILGDLARAAYDQRIVDYIPMIFSTQFKPYRRASHNGKPIDVLMLVVSPPDKNGFCSFGGYLWNKHSLMKQAKRVVAQVDETQIRTYGTNYAHVSEFDYFVEYTPPVMTEEEVHSLLDSMSDAESKAELGRLLPHMDPRERSEFLPRLAVLEPQQIRTFGVNQGWLPPPEEVQRISQYVAELVRDGDTLQIGTGTPGRFLPTSGTFDHKRDLGWHSEMGAPGVISLIEKGIITGTRKTCHRGKAVFSALTGATPAELRYAHNHPLIEQFDAECVATVLAVAAHDNMVSLNNALSVDFSGQINAETLFGTRLMSGTGGQLDFQMGAILSKGGRAITLLRSTALGGTVSRIVPQLEEGTVVTIPRTFTDTIVTEYGVARLLGKSLRERARELINVAHPDFRSDLKRAADRLLYP